MRSLYRSLLYFYPIGYRAEYGEEMTAVFLEARSEAAKRGVMAQAMFGVRELVGLLRGALREQLRSITGSHGTALFSTRRLSMHSEFRFPKATVSLMVIILVGILLTIDKAKSISASVSYSRPNVGPIHAAQQLMLLPTLLIILSAAGAVGVIAWGILFALQRSGLQRLSDVNPTADQRPGGKFSL
jgi:hypothetical protein